LRHLRASRVRPSGVAVRANALSCADIQPRSRPARFARLSGGARKAELRLPPRAAPQALWLSSSESSSGYEPRSAFRRVHRVLFGLASSENNIPCFCEEYKIVLKHMSVQACSRCHSWYSRWKGIFLPRGYCSWLCWAARTRRNRPQRGEQELPASEIRLLVVAHRKRAHDGEPWMVWYPNCRECDRLEEMLADALAEAVRSTPGPQAAQAPKV
jgi:hypothetical protein